jgi:glycerophosphoryl diester phosphodiesterase
VEIFAHRGFTLERPENSLAALQAAMDLGLHGSEVDLRTTKDGQQVLLHDPNLERTSTGKGPVSEQTLHQLRNLRLKDPAGRVSDQRIPTLGEALETVKRRAGFRLVLDLKEVDPALTARQVLDQGLADRVVFFVADPHHVEQVRAIQEQGSGLTIAVDLLNWWKIEGVPSFVAKALGAKALFASEWFFPRCGFSEAGEAGAEVMTFLWGTHDLPQRMRRAVALGAQVVSSDRPDLLIQHVPALPAKP